MARSILTQNLRVRSGEAVIVEGWTHTLPWAVALSREARRLGAKPLLLYEDEDAYWDAVEHGEAKRMSELGGHEWAAVRAADVYIHLWGPGDRARLDALPAKTAGHLFGWNDRWYKEARKSGVRGARLELGRPYPSLAKLYGVEEAVWTDQLVRATLVDPSRLERSASPLVKALSRGKRMRIRHSNGTDLSLGLAHRPVQSSDARPHPSPKGAPYTLLTTVPGGNIALALDESVAQGTLVANRTNYYEGGTATGATFHFENGRLSEATFASGKDRFYAGFKTAGKGRDRPGMFRIGLNPELRNTPQLEDVEEGAVMVSVGNNRGIGGKNPAQFFGFAITAGATVEVDGQPLPI